MQLTKVYDVYTLGSCGSGKVFLVDSTGERDVYPVICDERLRIRSVIKAFIGPES